MQGVECLPDESEASLRSALAVRAPNLAGLPLRISPHARDPDPLWWSSSAVIDERYVAKYAWSDIRAERLWREGVLIERLHAREPALPIPEVVIVSPAPALVITRFAAGTPLSWEWAGTFSPAETSRVGAQIAEVLARLHAIDPSAILADLPDVRPVPQASTARLREAFPQIVDAARARQVLDWCGWVDDALSESFRPEGVLVHGDLHGYNQLWDVATLDLTLVVDFETCGVADPHFDFRYLPGNAPTPDLALAVMDAYAQATSRALAIERVMAWHVLTVLGDALWRTAAGVGLPDGGPAATCVDDLARRLAALRLDVSSESTSANRPSAFGAS